jgi:hypothetical protein
MAYIIVGDNYPLNDGTIYKVTTAEEIAIAQAALLEVGEPWACVWAGEPDGLGDSYRNGQILFAPDATRFSL